MRFIIRFALYFLLFAGLTFKVFGQEVPGRAWKYQARPLQGGWDLVKLDRLKKYLIDSTFITGFMVVQHGEVVFEYGDVEENSYIASCRKSVLAILYGAHIKTGEINLHATLRELGIDDVGGLLPQEKGATVEDLLSARSGVFHPASYPGDYLDQAPKRGSVEHGTYWLYSNWDFNVAGYIFEKQTHQNIYDEVERVLAIPLQMQDWNRSLQHKEGDSSKSKYLAYPMWFSTRDMARIGLLMLNKGRWARKQLIDSCWVAEMVKAKTDYREINHNVTIFRGMDYSLGYGYLWWIWQNMKDKKFNGAYSALGSMGQSISVFPAEDVVIAYKTKAAYQRANSLLQRFKVITLALNAADKP